MTDTSLIPPSIPALLASIQQIDLMLRQANCILMYAQPKRPGKITLSFPREEDASGFAIPKQPRVVQWHLNVRANKWYVRTIPLTHLSKRAKGKDEFSTGYYHTAQTLGLVSELLANRKRAVAILHSLAVKATFFQKATADWMGETAQELSRVYVQHSHLRRGHGPAQEEWNWFASGGVSAFPGEAEDEYEAVDHDETEDFEAS